MLENFDLVEKLPEPKETMTISIENIQKSFQCKFCDQWSVSFILKSFYQIPLTWSKIYRRFVTFLVRKADEHRILQKCEQNSDRKNSLFTISRTELSYQKNWGA